MFFSNAVAKPFTILHQLVFSFAKAFLPPGIEPRQKKRTIDKSPLM